MKNSSDVKSLLFEVICDVGKDKYDPKFLASLDDDLSKLGMNSLTFIKLLLQIEKRFDLEIDFEVVPMETLNSLSQFVSYLFENSPLVIDEKQEAL